MFLDEIGEMDLRLQAKLLRVLEDKTFRRVGGTRDIRVDVRVLAATNVSLEGRVRDGRFREDLFYRLSVIPVRVPPLRERGEDILLLADTFLRRYNHEFSRNVMGFSGAAREALMAYRWPGNVRELRNVVERTVLLETKDLIEPDSLPTAIVRARPPKVLGEEGAPLEPFHSAKGKMVESFEKEYLERLLRACEGNVTQAALIAEMDRSSLQRLFRKHGLVSRTYRSAPETAATP